MKRCPTAKIRHETQEEAVIAQRQSHLRNSPPLYVYECWQCSGWHLTRTAPKEPTTKRKK